LILNTLDVAIELVIKRSIKRRFSAKGEFIAIFDADFVQKTGSIKPFILGSKMGLFKPAGDQTAIIRY
jgi:hypothetical protein